jgi:hypothetical protein
MHVQSTSRSVCRHAYQDLLLQVDIGAPTQNHGGATIESVPTGSEALVDGLNEADVDQWPYGGKWSLLKP